MHKLCGETFNVYIATLLDICNTFTPQIKEATQTSFAMQPSWQFAIAWATSGCSLGI